MNTFQRHGVAATQHAAQTAASRVVERLGGGCGSAFEVADAYQVMTDFRTVVKHLRVHWRSLGQRARQRGWLARRAGFLRASVCCHG